MDRADIGTGNDLDRRLAVAPQLDDRGFTESLLRCLHSQNRRGSRKPLVSAALGLLGLAFVYLLLLPVLSQSAANVWEAVITIESELGGIFVSGPLPSLTLPLLVLLTSTLVVAAES